MNRILGATLGLLLALLTFIAVLILEGILFSMLMPSTNIGWDPVSLWRQSLHGKVTLILIIVTPLVVPFILAAFAFRLVVRQFSST